MSILEKNIQEPTTVNRHSSSLSFPYAETQIWLIKNKTQIWISSWLNVWRPSPHPSGPRTTIVERPYCPRSFDAKTLSFVNERDTTIIQEFN